MLKFKPAVISDAEVMGTARAWLLLYKNGDANTIKVVGEDCPTDEEALKRLVEYSYEAMRGQVFINDKYQVIRNEIGSGMVHLSIKLLSKSHEHDWRDYQQIKNEMLGEECEAIEIYPAESRLVDCANQFHLFGWSDPSYRIPIGYTERCVSEISFSGSQQRPFGNSEGS